jgi:hypothetical protein
VQAEVALALLETVRNRDQPNEILDDENVSVTLPRRFGLSGVVEDQIHRYQQEARRGRRIPEVEVRDLIRLVARRADARWVFHEVGCSLMGKGGPPVLRKVLPKWLLLNLARNRIQRRLGAVFGGKFLSTGRGRFQIEATHQLLVEADPGGDACALVTGLSQTVIDVYGSAPRKVIHLSCGARSGEKCRWELEEPSREEASDNG